MFAKILERLDQQTAERDEFRQAVIKRFDEGTERMAAQDAVLDEIKIQTTKTNGRVLKLETKWRVVTTKILGAILVLCALWRGALWLYEQGFRITH